MIYSHPRNSDRHQSGDNSKEDEGISLSVNNVIYMLRGPLFTNKIMAMRNYL